MCFLKLLCVELSGPLYTPVSDTFYQNFISSAVNLVFRLQVVNINYAASKTSATNRLWMHLTGGN